MTQDITTDCNVNSARLCILHIVWILLLSLVQIPLMVSYRETDSLIQWVKLDWIMKEGSGDEGRTWKTKENMAHLVDKCYSVSISCCHLRAQSDISDSLCQKAINLDYPINLLTFTRCQLIKKKHETLCSSIKIQLQTAIGPWLPFCHCLSECSPRLILEFQEHHNTMFWLQTFLPALSVISTFTICLRDVVNLSLLLLSAYWLWFILRWGHLKAISSLLFPDHLSHCLLNARSSIQLEINDLSIAKF